MASKAKQHTNTKLNSPLLNLPGELQNRIYHYTVLQKDSIFLCPMPPLRQEASA